MKMSFDGRGLLMLMLTFVASRSQADVVPFDEVVISNSALDARSVHAADLDGDGDTDVLSASVGDNKIAWYENDGASPPDFTERVVSANALAAISVHAADVDGDGHVDVLSASFNDNKIAWYENDGASPPDFIERIVSTNALGALAWIFLVGKRGIA